MPQLGLNLAGGWQRMSRRQLKAVTPFSVDSGFEPPVTRVFLW